MTNIRWMRHGSLGCDRQSYYQQYMTNLNYVHIQYEQRLPVGELLLIWQKNYQFMHRTIKQQWSVLSLAFAVESR